MVQVENLFALLEGDEEGAALVEAAKKVSVKVAEEDQKVVEEAEKQQQNAAEKKKKEATFYSTRAKRPVLPRHVFRSQIVFRKEKPEEVKKQEEERSSNNNNNRYNRGNGDYLQGSNNNNGSVNGEQMDNRSVENDIEEGWQTRHGRRGQERRFSNGYYYANDNRVATDNHGQNGGELNSDCDERTQENNGNIDLSNGDQKDLEQQSHAAVNESNGTVEGEKLDSEGSNKEKKRNKKQDDSKKADKNHETDYYINRMTLKEYQELQSEKRKNLDSLKKAERKVSLDEDFESMRLVEKNNEDDDISMQKNLEKDMRKKKENKKAMSIDEFLKPQPPAYGGRRTNGQMPNNGDHRNSGGRRYGRPPQEMPFGGRGKKPNKGAANHNGPQPEGKNTDNVDGGDQLKKQKPNGGGESNEANGCAEKPVIPAPNVEDLKQFPALGGQKP